MEDRSVPSTSRETGLGARCPGYYDDEARRARFRVRPFDHSRDFLSKRDGAENFKGEGGKKEGVDNREGFFWGGGVRTR